MNDRVSRRALAMSMFVLERNWEIKLETIVDPKWASLYMDDHLKFVQVVE